MRALIALFALASLTACGSEPSNPIDSSRVGSFDAHASDVIEQWKDSGNADSWHDGLIMLDEAVKASTDTTLTETQSQALFAGWFTIDTDIDIDAPDPLVTWSGGQTTVTTFTIDEAIANLTHSGPPPSECTTTEPPDTTDDDDTSSHSVSCEPLTVTSITTGTTKRWTNHGTIELPAYLYSVAGIKQPVSQVAFTSPNEAPAPLDVPDFNAPGITSAMTIVGFTDEELEFTIGIGACDNDPTALIYETDDAIVIAGTATYDGSAACTDQLLLEPVTASLESAVNDRPIINALSGNILHIGRWA